LQNLRIYLEKHRGAVRRLISERIKVEMPRQKFWEHLLSATGGFVIVVGALKTGDWIELNLSQLAAVRAMVELVVEGHGLGVRVRELCDAMLCVEREGKGDKCHVGYWSSVYDEAKPKALETPAKLASQRIHESL